MPTHEPGQQYWADLERKAYNLEAENRRLTEQLAEAQHLIAVQADNVRKLREQVTFWKKQADEEREQAAEQIEARDDSPWTIEYRPEAGGWEVMQGSAHRGIYRTEAEARAALAARDGDEK